MWSRWRLVSHHPDPGRRYLGQAYRLLKANPALTRLPNCASPRPSRAPTTPSGASPPFTAWPPSRHWPTCSAIWRATASVSRRCCGLFTPWWRCRFATPSRAQAAAIVSIRAATTVRRVARSRASARAPGRHPVRARRGQHLAAPRTDAPPAEIVHWLARRPATGESFEAVIAPRHALAPTTPFHLRLGSGELLAAKPGNRSRPAGRRSCGERCHRVVGPLSRGHPGGWRFASAPAALRCPGLGRRDSEEAHRYRRRLPAAHADPAARAIRCRARGARLAGLCVVMEQLLAG